jgi:hypothetical protein
VNGPFRPSPALGNTNWQFYSLVEDLNGLVALGAARNVPNIALNAGLLPGLAATAGNNGTPVLSLGNPGSPAVVITGGIHAREWIAAEIAYLIAEYLIVNYPQPAVAPTARQAFLQNLVNTRDIRIIPMVNPDGNVRTVTGPGANDRMWRKNRRVLPATPQAWVAAFTGGGGPNPPPFRNVKPTYGLLQWASYDVPDYDPAHNIPPGGPGNNPHYQGRMLYENEVGVDLNRNMATPAWGYDCPPRYANNAPEGDTFFGTTAGGEPETGNVAQVMAAAAAAAAGGTIAVAIDYHCYSRMILYPDEVPAGGLSPSHKNLGVLLQDLIKDGNGQQYQLGDATSLLQYSATGTVADRALRQHQARSFTIELDPAHGTPPGFRLGEGQIQAVFETNILGALAAIAAPGTWQARQQVRGSFLSWHVHGRGNQLPP